jgi:GLPGLI family protein
LIPGLAKITIMHKKISLLTISFFCCLQIFAQQKDFALSAARYVFYYVTDTAKPAKSISEDVILYLGKDKSAFKSYNTVLRDSISKEQIAQLELQVKATGSINVNKTNLPKGVIQSVYKDFGTGKLNGTQQLIKEYMIEEQVPVINWVISPETKNIRELACQKATASFRGRNYTAWFTTQLPYDNGPWKLGGLPGLILEANDDKNEVVFKFAGFEDVSQRQIALTPFTPTIKAAPKEFARLREAADKDPEAFIRNSAGNNVKFTVLPSLSIIQKASKNPIELVSDNLIRFL